MEIIFQSESETEQEFEFEGEILINKGVVTIFALDKNA
jgi:hypothetical protein